MTVNFLCLFLSTLPPSLSYFRPQFGLDFLGQQALQSRVTYSLLADITVAVWKPPRIMVLLLGCFISLLVAIQPHMGGWEDTHWKEISFLSAVRYFSAFLITYFLFI